MSRVAAIVPGRAGSKGVSGKNLKKLGGVPLVAISAMQALKSGVDTVIVTSDDTNVLAAARDYLSQADPGRRRWVTWLRPKYLARDYVQLDDVCFQIATEMEDITTCVLLQPTSPFRETGEIDRALNLHIASGTDLTVVSGFLLRDKVPGFLWGTVKGTFFSEMIPFGHTPSKRRGRQWGTAWTGLFKEDGAIYVFNADTLRFERSFRTDRAIPFIRQSANSIDIDTQADWLAAERYAPNFFAHHPAVTLKEWAMANREFLRRWAEENPKSKGILAEYLE